MKVRIYNEEGGTQAFLVEPSPGRGLPPVLVQGVKREDVRSTVEPIIIRLRRQEPAPFPPGG